METQEREKKCMQDECLPSLATCLLSDASTYCDVILAPRVTIVLVRCGAWYDKARAWPLNKGIIEHTCIYEGGTDTLHSNLT